MIIHEACAWVIMSPGKCTASLTVRPLPEKRYSSLSGTLTVIVQHPGNQKNEYSATTDDNSVFIAREVPLKYGDKVMLKMSGVASPSAVDATIPFKEISLWSADYYAGVAEGQWREAGANELPLLSVRCR